MYICITIIIGLYSGYSYNNIVLLCACIGIQVNDVTISPMLLYRSACVCDADGSHICIYQVYTYIIYIFVHCASMPTIYVLTHTYIVLKTRDQFPQTLLLHLWQCVVLGRGIIEEINTCHPRRFDSRSVTGNRPSGCYIIILYALCNHTRKPSPRFRFIPFVFVR